MGYPCDYDLWCRLTYANYVVDYKYFRQTGNDHWDSLYYALESMHRYVV